jgi:hypothetical protein
MKQMIDRFEVDVIHRHRELVVILAGANAVYPDWVLCGGPAELHACRTVGRIVGHAEVNSTQPIFATTVGLARPQLRGRRVPVAPMPWFGQVIDVGVLAHTGIVTPRL